MDRRLGRPLPHQPANPTWAHLSPRGLSVPRFHPQVLCGISVSFPTLSPSKRQIPMHYSPVRHSTPGASSIVSVRLACVKHAASVQSEPESNSSVYSLPKPYYCLSNNLSSDVCLFLCQSVNPTNKSTATKHPHKLSSLLLKIPVLSPPRRPCTVARPRIIATPISLATTFC